MQIRSFVALALAASPCLTACSDNDSKGGGATTPGTGGILVPSTGGSVALPPGGAASSTGAGAPLGPTGGVATSTGGTSSTIATGGAPVSTGGISSRGGTTSSIGGATASGGQVPTASAGTASSSGGASSGVCTDASPDDNSCETWQTWGNCGSEWFLQEGFCEQTCGTCSGSSSSGGAPATGGSPSTGGSQNTGGMQSTGGTREPVDDPPPLSNPQSGFTTHYWDCCKPHCGWSGNVSGSPMSSCDANNQSLGGDYDATSACDGGNAHQCWSAAPWAVSDTLSYGFAAFNGGECGTCYQIEFNGGSHSDPSDPGVATLSNKTMIVQAVNRGGIAGEQFDLLVPGGGVGDFDACSSQWGASNLGERYGGFFLRCRKDNSGNLAATKDCARQFCNSVFASDSMGDLLSGCLWYVDWMNVADNPTMDFQEVECPAALRAASGL